MTVKITTFDGALDSYHEPRAAPAPRPVRVKLHGDPAPDLVRLADRSRKRRASTPLEPKQAASGARQGKPSPQPVKLVTTGQRFVTLQALTAAAPSQRTEAIARARWESLLNPHLSLEECVRRGLAP